MIINISGPTSDGKVLFTYTFGYEDDYLRKFFDSRSLLSNTANTYSGKYVRTLISDISPIRGATFKGWGGSKILSQGLYRLAPIRGCLAIQNGSLSIIDRFSKPFVPEMANTYFIAISSFLQDYGLLPPNYEIKIRRDYTKVTEYPKIGVGIELEGGYHAKKLPNKEWAKGDGSIHDVTGNAYEITSKVFPSKSSQWKKWVKRNYPSNVNVTCGGHIHFGFFMKHITGPQLRNINHCPIFFPAYSEMAKEPNYKRFRKELSERAAKNPNIYTQEFWSRLQGGNQFTMRDFNPVEQIYGSFTRYTTWNFCAFNAHRSLECRLLPMGVDAESHIRALSDVIEIVTDIVKNIQIINYTMEVKCVQ